MKKIALFVICALVASVGASAQPDVVKNVKKLLDDKNYASARQQIIPALTNPQSMNNPETWYIAGKAEFDFFKQQDDNKMLKRNYDEKAMTAALSKGYEYLSKAIALDTVPEVDKKGNPKLDKAGNPKIKTEFSGRSVDMIVGHQNDYLDGAVYYYNNKDYKAACDMWQIFVDLNSPAAKEKYKEKAPNNPDTIIGQVQYYQGLAYWQNEDNANAIKSFEAAIANNINDETAYEYLISNYSAVKDFDSIVKTAEKAYKKFGSKGNSKYVTIVINDMIDKEKYDEAKVLLNEILAENPNNPEYFNVMGTLYEYQKNPDLEKALEYYKKSVEANPEYAKGLFDVGRYYYNKAVVANDQVPKDLRAVELKAQFDKNVRPYYEEALPYMEKAYNIDKENKEVRRALANIYYLLGMEDKLNALDSAN